jgi:sensor histidine kinase YesM
MEMIVWNSVLSLLSGIFIWILKEKSDELKRVEILLNRTREEVARDYTTNAEVQRITDHIDQRFNRLEAKIDELIRAKG